MRTRTLITALAGLALILGPAPAGAAPTPGGPGKSSGKVGSALVGLQASQRAGQNLPNRATSGDLDVTPGERVMVDIHVTGDAEQAAGRLRAAGMQVLATGQKPLAMVEGLVAVADLDAIAALAFVRTISPVTAGGVDPVGAVTQIAAPDRPQDTQATDVGAVLSAGDAAHRGPAARALGPTGSAVKVGVISDSINQVGTKIAGSQASGDLPAGSGVQVLSDHVGGSDEGRAMAEIIYDEAPGIPQFVFASGTASGAVGKANAIDALVAQGVDVIADDIFYITEPFFQDGQVAQAVDNARAAGVTYFASAGNRARQSWEGTYSDNPASPGQHRFSPANDSLQTLTTVPNGAYIQVAMQWDEPWGGATTDIDVQLLRADGTALPSATTGGIDDNLVAGGSPLEVVTWTNNSGAPVSVGLIIRRFAGSGSPFLKYIARGNFGAFNIAEYATNSDTINPDAAAAAGSIAVAAVNAADAGTNTPESFSSRGPKQRRRDKNGVALPVPEIRQKPQIAAADAVNTTVPGFAPFFGTSAATPSAAGIAALLISARPSLTPAQVEAIMTEPSRAVDCEPAGARPDSDCGAGFVFADSGVLQAQDLTAPAVSVTTTGPSGSNGWRTGDVNVAWVVTETGSVIVSRTGCLDTAITTDTTGTQLNCVATSIGGTTSDSVLIRRDTVQPTVPVFTGISPGNFTPATLPAPGSIGCNSTDATSGVASCTVSGYDSAVGVHTLTALAVDQAGLSSTATLQYTVSEAASGTPSPTATPTPTPTGSATQNPPAPAPVIMSFTGPMKVKRKKPAVFGVTVDQASSVTVAFAKQSKGRSVNGQCVAQSKKNRKAKKCLRFTDVGSFAANLVPGANTVVFSGRLNGRALAKATYRVTATPSGAGGPGAAVGRTLKVS